MDFRVKIKIAKPHLVSQPRIRPAFRRVSARLSSASWLQEQRQKLVESATTQAKIAARKLVFVVRWFESLRQARRKIATAALAAFTLWLGVHVMFGPNGTRVYRHKRVEARQLQQQIDSLEKENGALSEQIKALQTDPKAIEREAREQLHYVRPDEIIYVAPYQEPAAPPATHAAQK